MVIRREQALVPLGPGIYSMVGRVGGGMDEQGWMCRGRAEGPGKGSASVIAPTGF